MGSKLKKWLGTLLPACVSGALYLFGTGLHPHWYLAWLAPIPVLLAAPQISRRAAALAAFAAFALGELNMFTYARAIIPLPVLFLLVIAPAAIFAAFVLVFRMFARRGQLVRAALSMPALWVAYEYLSELRSPHATFGNLAYTQMGFLPILQMVSLTGIWSISFLLFLLPAAIAAIFAPGAALRRKIAVALGALVVFAGVLGFGWQRLQSGSQGPAVRIGLIDTDTPRYPDGEASLALVRAYAEHISAPARDGAQVVVIPEKIGRYNESEVGESDRILEQAAQDNHVTIVAGLLHLPNLNETRIYSPQGSLEATYEKHHMLPPFESDLVAGTTRTLLNRPSGRWGVEICKDMDFPALSRQYGADGIGLLLVPAWDFVADGWLHGRMAILRGVESGFSIARSAKQGTLTVTDDRGRVLAERTTDSAGFDIVVADVPVANERTFYSRAGDWFARFDLALVTIIFLSLALRPLRRARLKQQTA
jgi:apolipoprotein N-acyltransferase